jgi:hypothetical protein
MTRVGQAQRAAGAHPGSIRYDSSLSEVVEFEIPSFEDATRLGRCLEADWFTWIHNDDGPRVVVMLVPYADDLAALLRTVLEWSRKHGGGAVPFELDGRRYVLESPTAPRTDLAA